MTVGILAIVAGGTVAAFGGIAHVSSPDPQREAAERLLRDLATITGALSKYTDPAVIAVNAAPVHTSMPVPGGTPVPITITASKDGTGAGPFQLTISIQYPHGHSALGWGTATLSRTLPLVQKAPPPNASITSPGRVSDPNATPTP
ncbi:MAG: hypothetical protein NVSMB31_11650 [Vulcanimicrobiaceae bacterium]